MSDIKVVAFGKAVKIPANLYTKYKNLYGEPDSNELENIALSRDPECGHYDETKLQDILIKEFSWRGNIRLLTDDMKKTAIKRWISNGKR